MQLLSRAQIEKVNGGNSETDADGFTVLMLGWLAALIIQPQQQTPALAAVAYTSGNDCLYKQSEPCLLAHENDHTLQQG